MISPESEAAANRTCMMLPAHPTAGEQFCGLPATTHVCFMLNGTHEFTFSCDGHMHHWIREQIADMHKIQGMCGLPGARWVFSTKEKKSRCEIEGFEDTSDLVREVALAFAHDVVDKINREKVLS